MSVRELPKPESDVRKVLEHALSQADGFNGVFIVADTDKGPWIRSSTMSGLMKTYLIQFMQAWVIRWLMEGMVDVDPKSDE